MANESAKYAAFAARMLAATAELEAAAARANARFATPVASQSLETVRPSK